jgi:hypothetical protein
VPTAMERFEARVDKSAGPNGCWPWTGGLFKTGYGRFYDKGKHHVAHRWLLGELRGQHLNWPEERGCHKCDNPPCCNPAHLYIGDAASNQADAAQRSGYEWTRTHCPAGHEYTAENTYTHPVSGKHCRQCRHDRNVTAQRAKGAKPGGFKTLRGHAMADSNIYVHQKTGRRECRACRNLRVSEWAKKKRAEHRETRAK